MKRPVAIDLYAGAGGLSLGLEQAGFDIALAIDRDPYHVSTHERNFPYGKSHCANIAEMTGAQLRELAGIEQEVTLICGGPPCQGFSTMGKRYAADPRNTLADHFARLVVEVLPQAFLMENVPGMQSGATAEVYERVIKTLGRHYSITTPVRTLNASAFGVPQKRERLFVVGVRKDLRHSAQYPQGPCSEQPERPTVWQAIEDLPGGDRESLLQQDSSPYDAVGHGLHPYVLTARGLRSDPCDLSYSREWDRSRVSGCRRVNHRPDIVQLYAATAPGAVVPAHNLPRLSPNGLAPTLRAGTDSEHGSYNAPRPVHPFEPRCITVREAARLHGYPDWFDFYPVKWHAHRQIGNSVCPPIARALGGAIVRALGLRPFRPSNKLPLRSDFRLPPNAAKHHKRITQMEEWPKILDRLLHKARVVEKGKVKHPTFTVDDVQRAYKEAEAEMPRTPPDRFLQDIARSRNRRWIMSGVLSEGLSIETVLQHGIYGRFVRKGTPGTLDSKDFITVSSEEIALATRIPTVAGARLSDESIADYVTRKKVSDALFTVGQLEVTRNESNGARSKAHAIGTFTIRNDKRQLRSGIIIRGVGQELPALSAVAALMGRKATNSAIVLSAITQRHFVAVLVSSRSGRLLERRRGVFEIGPAPNAKSLPQTN